MEKYQYLVEDAVIFLIMAIFSVMRNLVNSDKPISWAKSFTKMLSNLVAGLGLYSFLLSYKSWYGEYPQKIGVIMLVTYAGSKMIDLIVDKIFDWIKKLDFRKIIKKLLEL